MSRLHHIYGYSHVGIDTYINIYTYVSTWPGDVISARSRDQTVSEFAPIGDFHSRVKISYVSHRSALMPPRICCLQEHDICGEVSR